MIDVARKSRDVQEILRLIKMRAKFPRLEAIYEKEKQTCLKVMFKKQQADVTDNDEDVDMAGEDVVPVSPSSSRIYSKKSTTIRRPKVKQKKVALQPANVSDNDEDVDMTGEDVKPTGQTSIRNKATTKKEVQKKKKQRKVEHCVCNSFFYHDLLMFLISLYFSFSWGWFVFLALKEIEQKQKK